MPIRLPVAVSAAVGVGLAVAVGTAQLDVLRAVVRPIAVLVMQLGIQRLAAPVGESALFTPVLLKTGLHQPRLQVAAAGATPDHEQLFQGNLPVTRNDVAPFDCSAPCI